MPEMTTPCTTSAPLLKKKPLDGSATSASQTTSPVCAWRATMFASAVFRMILSS